jgi:predicted ribosomally synthesized peptide with nif11-like leader
VENVKKFYDALATDSAMQERAKALNDEKPEGEEAVLAAIVAFAEKEGYTFTAEELAAYTEENSKGELREDELEMVAGGGEPCVCVVGGHGGGEYGECGCIVYGNGYTRVDGDERFCFCFYGGGGDEM